MRLAELPGLRNSARPQKAIMTEERESSRWQRQLLPLMVSMLVLLTSFFCVGITVETYRIQKHLEEGHEVDLQPALARLGADLPSDISTRIDLARFQATALLESSALQSRYHQASIAQLIRVSVIFLGFLTGMILALVGAAFILGKMREVPSNIEGQGPGLKLALSSGSPGLVLAVLGTVLMIATIWARVEINVTDAALYFSPEIIQMQKAGTSQSVPAAAPSTSGNENRRSDFTKELGAQKPK
jgi:hypothetical protein